MNEVNRDINPKSITNASAREHMNNFMKIWTVYKVCVRILLIRIVFKSRMFMRISSSKRKNFMQIDRRVFDFIEKKKHSFSQNDVWNNWEFLYQKPQSWSNLLIIFFTVNDLITSNCWFLSFCKYFSLNTISDMLEIFFTISFFSEIFDLFHFRTFGLLLKSQSQVPKTGDFIWKWHKNMLLFFSNKPNGFVFII